MSCLTWGDCSCTAVDAGRKFVFIAFAKWAGDYGNAYTLPMLGIPYTINECSHDRWLKYTLSHHYKVWIGNELESEWSTTEITTWNRYTGEASSSSTADGEPSQFFAQPIWNLTEQVIETGTVDHVVIRDELESADQSMRMQHIHSYLYEDRFTQADVYTLMRRLYDGVSCDALNAMAIEHPDHLVLMRYYDADGGVVSAFDPGYDPTIFMPEPGQPVSADTMATYIKWDVFWSSYFPGGRNDYFWAGMKSLQILTHDTMEYHRSIPACEDPGAVEQVVQTARGTVCYAVTDPSWIALGLYQ